MRFSGIFPAHFYLCCLEIYDNVEITKNIRAQESAGGTETVAMISWQKLLEKLFGCLTEKEQSELSVHRGTLRVYLPEEDIDDQWKNRQTGCFGRCPDNPLLPLPFLCSQEKIKRGF